MEWIKITDRFPEDGLEVLCAITKYGRTTVDKSTEIPHIDENGKKWYKMTIPVQYEMLWRDEGKWVGWNIDDYERNPDYKTVIAWADRLDYELD